MATHWARGQRRHSICVGALARSSSWSLGTPALSNGVKSRGLSCAQHGLLLRARALAATRSAHTRQTLRTAAPRAPLLSSGRHRTMDTGPGICAITGYTGLHAHMPTPTCPHATCHMLTGGPLRDRGLSQPHRLGRREEAERRAGTRALVLGAGWRGRGHGRVVRVSSRMARPQLSRRLGVPQDLSLHLEPSRSPPSICLPPAADFAAAAHSSARLCAFRRNFKLRPRSHFKTLTRVHWHGA